MICHVDVWNFWPPNKIPKHFYNNYFRIVIGKATSEASDLFVSCLSFISRVPRFATCHFAGNGVRARARV